MVIALFKKLLRQQLITQQEYENVRQQEMGPVSVYWDVTTILYAGILLFTGGLSILVYKNIDSIGHAVIISTIAIMCAGIFVYCFKHAKGYSNSKVETPNPLFDYILLLGCLLLVTLVGYLQFQYHVFGNDWGLASFVPMVLLFAIAYYFDHLAVLSMAITNVAAWAGFTVAPLKVFKDNDFRNEHLIFAGLVLGAGLIAISIASVYRQFKAHFAFTYKNFGTHILFISLLAAMFHFDNLYLLWFLILLATVIFFLRSALQERSFYFLIITVLYGYIGISYVVINLTGDIHDSQAAFFLSFSYFIASGIGLIRGLIHYNKILRKNDDLQ